MRARDLLRRRSLLALLVAEIVSTTGAQMTWIALPWFVLVTTGSAARMGVVLSAELVGVALLGIPGGALSARLGARRTMLVADAVRAPLMVAIPVLHWTGALSFPLLVVLVFVLGAITAPYFAAQRVVIPELLGEDERVVGDANALLQFATRTTLLLGPIVGGVLIGLLSASSVLLVDAATYVVSLLLVGLFVPGRRVVAPPEETRDLLAGVRYLSREPLMRAWTVAFSVGDAAWYAAFAAIPFLAFTRYDSATLAGVLFACFGVGSVLGNALSFRLVRRIPPIRLVAWGAPLQALPLWLLVVSTPAWLVALTLIMSGVANGIANPSLHSIMTLRPPEWLRPQVITAVLTFDTLLGPVGYLAAGVVLERSGVDPVFVAVAVVQTVSMAWLSAAGLRYYRPATSSS
jgi:predicted MFS family arabinose efflux permease